MTTTTSPRERLHSELARYPLNQGTFGIEELPAVQDLLGDAIRLRQIRDLHAPVEWHEETESGSGELDLDKPLPPFCRECTDDEYVSAIEFGDAIAQGSPVVNWPCATRRIVDGAE